MCQMLWPAHFWPHRKRSVSVPMIRPMRVLQANLGRGQHAQDLVLQAAREEQIDVLLFSEICRPPRNNGRWIFLEAKKVAVVAAGELPIQRVWLSDITSLVAAQIERVVFFLSCYAPP